MREPLVLDPSAERIDQQSALDMVYPIVQDYGPPEPVLEALREAVSLVGRYPHCERNMRDALANYLGHESDQILPTVGANGGLDLVSRTWLQGCKLVLPTPAFWQLSDAPRRYQAQLQTVDLETEDAQEQILAAFADSEAGAILLCSPNNPLGHPVPQKLIDELLEIAKGRPVIVDESYADMEGISAGQNGLHTDLVLVRGFKTFTIPGARVGYVVASEERIRQLALMRPPFETNVLAEAAVLAVMENLEAVREIWQRVKSDRQHLEEGLVRLGGRVEPSSTLFTCWRHPQARILGRALFRLNVYTMFADRPVVDGMPDDGMRLTVRKPEFTNKVLMILQQILAMLPENAGKAP